MRFTFAYKLSLKTGTFRNVIVKKLLHKPIRVMIHVKASYIIIKNMD